MKILNRLVEPGDVRLHSGPVHLYTYPEQAWHAAAYAMTGAAGTGMDPSERMDTIRTMLDTDHTTTIGAFEVLRYAATTVDPVHPTAVEHRIMTAGHEAGIALSNLYGSLEGTWSVLVRTLLADLTTDSDSDGVRVRALIERGDLPAQLAGENIDRSKPAPVWLEGIVHHLADGDRLAVFADGIEIDLTAATYLHVTY
jgi:hypothetical protein